MEIYINEKKNMIVLDSKHQYHKDIHSPSVHICVYRYACVCVCACIWLVLVFQRTQVNEQRKKKKPSSLCKWFPLCGSFSNLMTFLRLCSI